MLPLTQLQKGQQVIIPLPGGVEVAGLVNLVQTASDGTVRVSGSLTGDHAGSFSLSQGVNSVGGRVLLQQEKLAYVVSTPSPGRMQMRELLLSDVICYPMPLDKADPQAAPPGSGPQAAPPLLQSRPGAAAVLYLDFEGDLQAGVDGPVTYPDWNGGVAFNPAASALSGSEITEVWNRVKEDYWPFNINVTTVKSDYLAAAVGRRMRVIITPTDTASPGVGGVAYVDSFSRAGAPNFNDDVPCWVFNLSVNGIAEAISHELGHTLGLHHDGQYPQLDSNHVEYYLGHGSGAVGWAPIMGAGYYQPLVQWSKGEYPNANNQEDDVAIISGTQATPLTGATNNTGYVTDDAGNTRGTAAAVDVSSGSLSVSGIVSSAADSDFYSFTLAAGKSVTINANPANTYAKQPNLDIQLELQDSGGTVLASSNPDQSLNATIAQGLSAGTYYVKVAGTGRSASGSDYGYSTYGSIGGYSLVGTIAAPTPPVIYSDSASMDSSAGGYSQLSVYATGNPTPTYQWQRMPTGSAVWSDLSDSSIFIGTHNSQLSILSLVSMNGDQFRCVVRNMAGSVTSMVRTLTVFGSNNALGWVSYNFPSVGATGSQVSGTATVINAGIQAWGPNHQLVLYDPGSHEVGSASLNGVAPGQSITVTIAFTVPVTPNLSYAYLLQAREVGVGSFGGIRSFSFGTFGAAIPPNIITQPISQAANVGDNISFTVVALGQTPFSYQWRRDGTDIPGATSATLALANVQVGAAGNYTVTVTNPLGSATSNPAILTVGIPPGVVSATAAGNYTMFLRSNGTRWVTGGGYDGALGDGTINSHSQPIQVNTGVAMIAGGPDQSAFVKLDGTLWAVGRYAGRLAGLGTDQQLSPVQVTNGTNVAAVEMGFGNTYFIRNDGTLWGAGNNNSGQVGDGTQVYRNTPVQIATGVTAIDGGNLHALFLKYDGTAWGMGYNSSGQLGIGSNSDAATPVLIAQNVAAVAAGINYSLVLKTNGTLWICGFGLSLVNSSSLVQIADGVQSIAAGDRHCLFIKTDGTLWAMGKNNAGQLGDTTTTDRATPVQVATGAIAISAGEQHSVFLKNDGSLWGMGSSLYWQLGTLAGGGSSRPIMLASGSVVGPAAPSAVSASDGTLAGAVLISWMPATGASGYEIWRNTTNASSGAVKIGQVNGRTLYYDVSGVPGTSYYYWVKSLAPGVTSDFSATDAGTGTSPVAPTILSQPANFSYPYNSSPLPSFTVIAAGNPAPSISWQLLPTGSSTWSDINSGSTTFTGMLTSTLSFTTIWNAFDGYQFRCIVTNGAGSVTSNAATLTVRASATDFNADGKSDLIWRQSSTGRVIVWLMNGTTRTSWADIATDTDWQTVNN